VLDEITLIYLHVGLHKTATTSMQKDIFQFINGVCFLGRKAALGLKEDDFYQRLSEYCHGNTKCEIKESSLSQELGQLEKTHKNILISDEWFTSDYSKYFGFNGAIWQEKLERLSRILKGLENSILISLREPSELAYSLFLEFTQIGLKEKNFDDYFKLNNDALTFDYPYLDSFISKLFQKVSYIKFDDIKDGSYRDKFKLFFSINNVNTIERTNAKNKNKDGIKLVITPKYIQTIRNICPSFILKFYRAYFRINLTNTIRVNHLSEVDRAVFNLKFKSSRLFYQNLK